MKHVIFDLGNVVAFFDHRRASRQLAFLAAMAVTEEDVFRVVFDTSLEPDLDCGRISSREFLGLRKPAPEFFWRCAEAARCCCWSAARTSSRR